MGIGWVDDGYRLGGRWVSAGRIIFELAVTTIYHHDPQ
jgi:hypothetical protein